MLGAYVSHGRVGQEILDVLVVAIRRTGRKDRHVWLQRSYLFFEGVPILLVLFLLNISERLVRVTPLRFKSTNLKYVRPSYRPENLLRPSPFAFVVRNRMIHQELAAKLINPSPEGPCGSPFLSPVVGDDLSFYKLLGQLDKVLPAVVIVLIKHIVKGTTALSAFPLAPP